MMVVLNGADLYTGNTAVVTAAALEGQISTGQLIKNWVVSYLGNFVGKARAPHCQLFCHVTALSRSPRWRSYSIPHAGDSPPRPASSAPC